jgi:hypothetical protein
MKKLALLVVSLLVMLMLAPLLIALIVADHRPGRGQHHRL